MPTERQLDLIARCDALTRLFWWVPFPLSGVGWATQHPFQLSRFDDETRCLRKSAQTAGNRAAKQAKTIAMQQLTKLRADEVTRLLWQ
jgi:hypothetical protein